MIDKEKKQTKNQTMLRSNQLKISSILYLHCSAGPNHIQTIGKKHFHIFFELLLYPCIKVLQLKSENVLTWQNNELQLMRAVSAIRKTIVKTNVIKLMNMNENNFILLEELVKMEL